MDVAPPHSIYISTAKMEVQSISGKWLALLFLKWAETQQLRSEIDSQKEVIDRRLAKLIVISERDNAKIESDSLRNTMKHFNNPMRLKDDEIAFHRAHVHQLSQKLPKALPEFTEEETLVAFLVIS